MSHLSHLGEDHVLLHSEETFINFRKDTSQDILAFLKDTHDSFDVYGDQETALAYLLTRALRTVGKSLLLVTPTDREAEKFVEKITFFGGNDVLPRPDAPLDRRVYCFPSRTDHKSHRLGKMETTAQRLAALYALKTSSFPILVVTSALALLEQIFPPEILTAHAEYRVVGEEIDIDLLCRRLIDRGYYRVPLVEEYGDLSRRGDVVDVYSPVYERPLRLEFFGDELESVRFFHPGSQRSMGNLEDVLLLPASEIILDDESRKRAEKAIHEDVLKENLMPVAGNAWLEKLQEGHQLSAFESVLPVFYEKPATLADYLPSRTVLVWSDTVQIHKEMNRRYRTLCDDWENNRSPHEWRRPPSELFRHPDQLIRDIGRFQQIRFSPLEKNTPSDVQTPTFGLRSFHMGASGHEALALTVRNHPRRERLLEPVARQFQKWQQEGISPFFVCSHQEQAKRMTELLNDYGVEALFSSLPFGEESFDAPAVKVVTGFLEKGFFWPAERLAVVSEEEIFGRRASRRRSPKSVSGIFLDSFQDLHAGDFIVHVDHGIGLYQGLVHLNIGEIESDFLHIAYQDGDRLYVPVDKFQKVQKYLGIEGVDPKVDKLGGKSWETAKKKAKESALKIARELLELYALRQVRSGHRFSPPDHFYREFETTFAYHETPDQMQAIEEVLEDMMSDRPMDRLICGDVGYGKTEVALRAAFKAIMDGKQVAMLVPTTVLAEQHSQTFLERFERFPVEVAVLSRFKTPAQQKQVLEGLKKGTIDLVVGTHRLLQKDVEFKDLGLIIIDEEHRFGVRHKEKLKQFRVSVDVLTLTATPIPRTLHMSLSGIRDLSTIETPPQDRHAIETYVCKYDDFIVREAVYRELHRGGQVFFVHNHVQSIHHMSAQLNRLVPEARIAVAHGQMKERELEKIMMDFVQRKVDVLVCTTIIESGLDIPSANTIIINRADRFGLAQIYQLRGRVGRSTEQAYAYLLIPGEHLIGRDARKRLRALMDFSELGAGFKIALNDLQIRGGGTILGSSQSGHIQAVGYELYLELLEKTIGDLKNEKTESESIDPEINVPLSVFLPESFIPDTDQRLLAYKKLATISEEADIHDLAAEWRDRYGPLPEEVKHLILLAGMRLLLKRLRIVRVDGDEQSFTLHFNDVTSFNRALTFLQEIKPPCLVKSSRKVAIEIRKGPLSHRVLHLKRILQEIGEHATD